MYSILKIIDHGLVVDYYASELVGVLMLDS